MVDFGLGGKPTARVGEHRALRAHHRLQASELRPFPSRTRRAAGVTGARVKTESRVEGLIEALKGQTDKPVCVGFGVSGPEQVHFQCLILFSISGEVRVCLKT